MDPNPKPNSGGAAFPGKRRIGIHESTDDPGMSVRMYIAVEAMRSLLAKDLGKIDIPLLPEAAFNLADQMIAQDAKL